MSLISGTDLAASIKKDIKAQVESYEKDNKRKPLLSVILVGDNPASQSYVKSKANACHAVGMENRTIVLDKEITQEKLEEVVKKENEDPNVDGILVQLPLPKHLDEKAVIRCIDPIKDVDGLHPINAGFLMNQEEGMVPCTPLGVMAMLESVGYKDLSGLKAVVIGRSNLVGKPVSLLLQNQNATVTTLHSKTKDIEKYIKEADIVVAALGKPEFVQGEWIKPGACVIDVGINRVDGHLVGDVDTKSAAKNAAFISPVPKGVGPMTVCMLLSNTLKAYKLREGIQ